MERCLSALMQQATDDLGTPACDTKKLFPAGPEQGVGRRDSCPGHSGARGQRMDTGQSSKPILQHALTVGKGVQLHILALGAR